MHIPEVEITPTQFRPSSSNFSGKTIGGLHFIVKNRDLFDSSRLGLAIAASLQALYPGKIVFSVNRDLIGNNAVIKALASGDDPVRASEEGLGEFLELRRKFLYYQ
jgi:uncharacterized protein YbbC (DUF1343 family)